MASQVRAFVDILEDEEHVEGNYYSPSMDVLTMSASDLRCPICGSPLIQIKSTAIFGRIVKDEERRRNGKTSAIVDILPPTHSAYSCDSCGTGFTINHADQV